MITYKEVIRCVENRKMHIPSWYKREFIMTTHEYTVREHIRKKGVLPQIV